MASDSSPEESGWLNADTRYRARYYNDDILIALGRLTVGASGLQASMANVFWRVLAPDDLDVGMRITANEGFQWLVNHLRALSEHKLPPEDHARVEDWIDRSGAAYAARNKIVHSTWGVNVATETSEISHVWLRQSARRKKFVDEVVPATADQVHQVAIKLEQLSLEALQLTWSVPVLRPATPEPT